MEIIRFMWSVLVFCCVCGIKGHRMITSRRPNGVPYLVACSDCVTIYYYNPNAEGD